MDIQVTFTIVTDKFVPETLDIVSKVLKANGVTTRNGIEVRKIDITTKRRGEEMNCNNCPESKLILKDGEPAEMVMDPNVEGFSRVSNPHIGMEFKIPCPYGCREHPGITNESVMVLKEIKRRVKE